MMGKTSKQVDYDIWQLVDVRHFETIGHSTQDVQFICDIDKTYLETAFESWVKVARIAFEDANDKITVSGASELLLSARWGNYRGPLLEDHNMSSYPRPLHFVSSSPPQLRNVLEEKLAIDGLDWSSDTFKNQAYNLKKIRFNMLKQQVAYKTAAILKLMEHHKDETSYYLIGDNAETDPFIYMGIKFLVEGKLQKKQFETYLSLLGVETELSQQLWRGLKRVPQCYVKAIFIRNISSYPYFSHPPLTDPIYLFESFYEVGIFLYIFKILEPQDFWNLLLRLHNKHGASLETMSAKLLNYLAYHTDPFIESKLDELKNIINFSSLKSYSKNLDDTFRSRHLEQWNLLKGEDILKLTKVWIDKIIALKKS